MLTSITYTDLSTELTTEKINQKVLPQQANVNWTNFVKKHNIKTK